MNKKKERPKYSFVDTIMFYKLIFLEIYLYTLHFYE